jgi:hypothetical protein
MSFSSLLDPQAIASSVRGPDQQGVSPVLNLR